MSKFIKYNKFPVLDLSHIITTVVFRIIYVLCVRTLVWVVYKDTNLYDMGMTEVL